MKEKILANFWLILFSGLAILGFSFIAAHYAGIAVAAVIVFGIILLALILISSNPFLGLLSLIFFLPFESFPAVDIGGLSIRLNQVLGLVTLAAWILTLMFRQEKISRYPAALPLGLFVIAMILSLTQAVDLTRAITVFIFIIFMIFISILTTNLINSKDRLIKVIWIYFFSAVIISLFAIFQFGGDIVGIPKEITLLKEGYTKIVFGFPRVHAFSMEPLYLANFLLVPIGLGLAFFFGHQEKEIKIRRLWLILFLIIILAIFFMTLSRGAYVGFIGLALIFLIFMGRKIISLKNIIIFVSIIAAIGWGAIYTLNKIGGRAPAEFIKHITVADFYQGESVQGRLNTYNDAYKAWDDNNHFLGIGLGNYGPYIKYYPAETPEGGWDIVNNEYLEILAETGLVGAVTFGLLLFFLIGRSIYAYFYTKDSFLKIILVGLFAALIAILIQYNFFSTLYIMSLWVLIGLLIAVQNMCIKAKDFIKEEN